MSSSNKAVKIIGKYKVKNDTDKTFGCIFMTTAFKKKSSDIKKNKYITNATTVFIETQRAPQGFAVHILNNSDKMALNNTAF